MHGLGSAHDDVNWGFEFVFGYWYSTMIYLFSFLQYKWIQKRFGDEWVHRTIITSDKTVVDGDILIDDRHFISGKKCSLLQRGRLHPDGIITGYFSIYSSLMFLPKVEMTHQDLKQFISVQDVSAVTWHYFIYFIYFYSLRLSIYWICCFINHILFLVSIIV